MIPVVGIGGGGSQLAKPKSKPDEKLDPMSLATWARLRAAGKIAKPNGAEKMSDNPSVKRPKAGSKKKG